MRWFVLVDWFFTERNTCLHLILCTTSGCTRVFRVTVGQSSSPHDVTGTYHEHTARNRSWRKLPFDELNYFCLSRNICLCGGHSYFVFNSTHYLKVSDVEIKSGQVWHIDCMEKISSAYRIAIGKFEEKRKPCGPRGKWADNTEIDVTWIWLEVATLNLFFVIVDLWLGEIAQSVQWLRYQLDDREIVVSFSAETALLRNVQTGSRAHPAPYSVGSRGCIPGCKAAGASRLGMSGAVPLHHGV